MKSKINKPKEKKPVIGYFIGGLIYTLAVLIIVVVRWSKIEYNVALSELLYTATTPLAGTDSGVFTNAIKGCLPSILILLLPYIIYVFLDYKMRVRVNLNITLFNKRLKFNLVSISRTILFLYSIGLFITSLIYADKEYKIVEFIKFQNEQTTVYENYYIDPASVDIRNENNKTKNLIFIYMESMETAYTSKELGGNQEHNIIPNLYRIAEENISFSNNEGFGGFRPFFGATWTMGALFSTSAGIPFNFPIEGNSMNKYEDFASGTTTLGDILAEKGYAQEFLLGSDASYAARDKFYKQHGDYKIFDLFTAREEGYIPEDYYVWWGYEDKYLYEIAKNEITNLASGDRPFNFTMLTADTHFQDGYICDLCLDEYSSVAENVVACADRQIQEFLEWCKAQDFYEDTVIVIIGEHPRMDTALTSGVKYYDRTIYNSFINSDKDINSINQYNREFTAMDIFPTIISSLGYKIEGDRLGLGTDVFSDRPTLLEELGYNALNSELNKQSNFYLKNFK